MRSKSKARKLTHDDHDEYEQTENCFSPPATLTSAVSPGDPRPEQPPIYIPEDIPIPGDFELKESSVYSGLGVWTNILIHTNQKFGPFIGAIKQSIEDTTCAWEVVIETDQSRFWIDASDPGTGNWMKYIRRSDALESRNLMAIQVQEQVYYRALRDICPGEEMLLYGTENTFPEKDLESFAFTKINEQDGTNYPCDCGEVFRSKVALKRHQTYACSHFDMKMTSSGINSEQHNNSHTEDEMKEHQIVGIGRSLTEGENSSDATEGGEKGEFKCEECPQSFQWKSNLIRHQIAHDSCRKFSCENCDKVFTDPSNLQRHIRSQHVGARSHACGECGKTFATSSGLKQHQHIHSSVKPFQCEVCLKAYTQFSNLCRHKRMHADCRQQIKCKDCGQAFSTVTSLSKHKRFCEGALRNGMHLGFPPTDKMNPLSLPSATHAPLNPALYMGMYRPPYPFYPPIGATFPVFPGSHPFSALNSPVSPSNPAKLAQPTSPDGKAMIPPHISPKLLSDDDKVRIKEEKLARRNSFGSESNDSPLSSGSDLDNSSASDAESESSAVKKPRLSIRPETSSEPRRLIFPSSQSRLTPDHVSPKITDRKLSASVDESSPNQEMPFDLSKTSKSSTPSPVLTISKDAVKSSGEQPLDLTRKATKEVTPLENARKTHIFGMPHMTPDTKLHYAYPQFGSPFLFDQLRVDKEKFQQSFQEAAKFMPFTRFPLGSPSYAAAAMGSFGMMKTEHGDKSLSPLMKMDKISDHFPYSSPGSKLKERYSCKFCGKVFPRSANLTRHLRTHTGEQPYKCKYCERSFSISSNLQRHVRNIHNKEKPFRCSLCDRCFGQQTNLDRHLKKHETEGPNVRDSPVNEPDLDSKDESYFSEIRNFIGKATDTVIPYTRVNGEIQGDVHALLNRQVVHDDKLDVADEEEEVDDLELDEEMEEDDLEENSSVESSPLKLSIESDEKVNLNNNRDLKPMTSLTNGFHINGDKLELISRPENDTKSSV